MRPDTGGVAEPLLSRLSACNGGNWYQYNYDGVINSSGTVYAHVEWEQWYAVSGCQHFMQQTKYHIIDGQSVWFQWGEADTPSGKFAAVGDYGNVNAAIPFNQQSSSGVLTYNYNNASATSSSVYVSTNYCTSVNAFGGCTNSYIHPADYLNN